MIGRIQPHCNVDHIKVSVTKKDGSTDPYWKAQINDFNEVTGIVRHGRIIETPEQLLAYGAIEVMIHYDQSIYYNPKLNPDG